MINQKPTNAFAYTLKTGFKGLPVLPALGNVGILGFFMIILAGSRLFTTEPLYNSSGEVSGYISARQKYVSLFFDDEYSVLICLVMIALCGIAMAICTFNFITSKKQVNVYYSLGITRTKLFLGKYISSALLLSASVFLPLLIMLIANLSALGFSGIVFESFFFYLLTFLVVSLSAFTITAAIFACVGTVFEAGVFSTIILFLLFQYVSCITEKYPPCVFFTIFFLYIVYCSFNLFWFFLSIPASEISKILNCIIVRQLEATGGYKIKTEREVS